MADDKCYHTWVRRLDNIAMSCWSHLGYRQPYPQLPSCSLVQYNLFHAGVLPLLLLLLLPPLLQQQIPIILLILLLYYYYCYYNCINRYLPQEKELVEELIKHLMGVPLQGETQGNKQQTGRRRSSSSSSSSSSGRMRRRRRRRESATA